ncbi:hypothetical protein L195_g061380, partial [Trifolium pratense]
EFPSMFPVMTSLIFLLNYCLTELLVLVGLGRDESDLISVAVVADDVADDNFNLGP